MPTGFTAAIDETPGYTWEEFLWRCVRGMGVAISMRDSDLSVPIPERLEPDVWERDHVEKLAAELAAAEKEPTEDYDRRVAAEHERALVSNEESHKRVLQAAKRYEWIRSAIEEWRPPTKEHEGLKRFALEQLETGKPYTTRYTPSPPSPQKEHLARLRVRLQEARARAAKTVAQAEDANVWLAHLRASVPQPPPRKGGG